MTEVARTLQIPACIWQTTASTRRIQILWGKSRAMPYRMNHARVLFTEKVVCFPAYVATEIFVPNSHPTNKYMVFDLIPNILKEKCKTSIVHRSSSLVMSCSARKSNTYTKKQYLQPFFETTRLRHLFMKICCNLCCQLSRSCCGGLWEQVESECNVEISEKDRQGHWR